MVGDCRRLRPPAGRPGRLRRRPPGCVRQPQPPPRGDHVRRRLRKRLPVRVSAAEEMGLPVRAVRDRRLHRRRQRVRFGRAADPLLHPGAARSDGRTRRPGAVAHGQPLPPGRPGDGRAAGRDHRARRPEGALPRAAPRLVRLPARQPRRRGGRAGEVAFFGRALMHRGQRQRPLPAQPRHRGGSQPLRPQAGERGGRQPQLRRLPAAGDGLGAAPDPDARRDHPDRRRVDRRVARDRQALPRRGDRGAQRAQPGHRRQLQQGGGPLHRRLHRVFGCRQPDALRLCRAVPYRARPPARRGRRLYRHAAVRPPGGRAGGQGGRRADRQQQAGAMAGLCLAVSGADARGARQPGDAQLHARLFDVPQGSIRCRRRLPGLGRPGGPQPLRADAGPGLEAGPRTRGTDRVPSAFGRPGQHLAGDAVGAGTPLARRTHAGRRARAVAAGAGATAHRPGARGVAAPADRGASHPRRSAAQACGRIARAIRGAAPPAGRSAGAERLARQCADRGKCQGVDAEP